MSSGSMIQPPQQVKDRFYKLRSLIWKKNRHIPKHSETIILCKCVSDPSRNIPYYTSILNNDGHLGFLHKLSKASLNYHS
jgi:hypothetical protein